MEAELLKLAAGGGGGTVIIMWLAYQGYLKLTGQSSSREIGSKVEGLSGSVDTLREEVKVLNDNYIRLETKVSIGYLSKDSFVESESKLYDAIRERDKESEARMKSLIDEACKDKMGTATINGLRVLLEDSKKDK